MRLFFFALFVFFSNTVFSQDPTVPSKAILSRLRTGSATVEQAPQKPATPSFKLKAMVFQDDNHGNAIVEVDGRRVYLKLIRNNLISVQRTDLTPKTQDGIQVGESLYRLVDFSAHSILLSDGTQEVLVH